MSDTNKDSKDRIGLIWILAIFFNWLSSLIFYITQKDDPKVHEESKLALNLSLNYLVVMIIIIIASALLVKIAAFLGIIVWLVGLVVFAGWVYVCYMHFKANKEGTAKPKIPYAIMFIK